eukprot:Gb_25719 [translate_table: standard]
MVSLSTMIGTLPPKTIRVQCSIKNSKLIGLIDLGGSKQSRMLIEYPSFVVNTGLCDHLRIGCGAHTGLACCQMSSLKNRDTGVNVIALSKSNIALTLCCTLSWRCYSGIKANYDLKEDLWSRGMTSSLFSFEITLKSIDPIQSKYSSKLRDGVELGSSYQVPLMTKPFAFGLSIASNSLVHGTPKRKDLANSQGTTLQRGENELEVTQVTRHGCDSMTRKIEDLAPQSHSNSCRDFSTVLGTLDQSNSLLYPDFEALPLLIEPGASQGSVDTNAHEGKLSSESVGTWSKGCWRHENRLWSLTQKYVPKTFKGLAGQNWVAQGLPNTIVRGNIGLAYLFYDPHGTCKTSCARKFATTLNCHSLE